MSGSTTTVNPWTLVARSFGFDPEESRHHFVVYIPRGAQREIQISEHLSWDERTGSSPVTTGQAPDGQIRAVLARPKWDAIADVVRVEFNRRLKRMGLRTGSWRLGPNLVRREMGKELVLLVWAIEDADPSLIPNAIANWQGLYPEERWWLYTQTAAATGHGLNDRGKGWRKAVRYALTENPVTTDSVARPTMPEFYRRAEAGPQAHFLLERDAPPDDLDADLLEPDPDLTQDEEDDR
ncbi:DUF3780 domain-containing protein [Litorilinea aerophila]|uniref:DUF3780 domain-containing protein n=1 Tax=Litorilinea aerophila TaxID=1204385 RepID=A0A540VA19_9CHLR|nr:DUF3780 domain-containing protein [Litorilinea aerophila]MCC9078499.1 DUF3780 domain-containing protein [Litorilinea aerophila]